jgi:drug/metabolite transporter (DMT)-like permease
MLKKQLSAVNPLTIHKRGTRAKALFALGLISFLWGTTWIASKTGVQQMPALQMAGMRQVLGGLLYLIYFASKAPVFPKGKQWVPILVLSFLNFFLTNGLGTWGVKYISSGLGAIIAAMFPLWLVVIAIIKGQRNISRQAIIGFVLGFGGICIIFYDHLIDFLQADFRVGIVLSVMASLTWAFGTLYTKQQALAFNPYFSIGLQMLIAGVALYSVAFATGDVVAWRDIPATAWYSIAYLAAIGSVFSFIA